MMFRVILSPFWRTASLLAALSTWGLSAPAQVHAQGVSQGVPQALTAGDEALLEMAQAFKRGDRKRLAAALPALRGHTLEPWAAYWEIKARLDEASASEVQEFLSRYAGTYQEDRLRNDWLLLLGLKRDWANFAAEHPRYRMGDDKEVRCYALGLALQRGSSSGTGALAGSDSDAAAQEVRKNWLGQREADDGCAWAAERFVDARKLTPADAWRKARLSIEANRPRAVRRAVDIADAQAGGRAAELLANAPKFLASQVGSGGGLSGGLGGGSGVGSTAKELTVLALVKMAMSDTDAAEAALTRWGTRLGDEDRNWVWGLIGRQIASRLGPDAVDKFSRVTRDADLSDDALGWKVRANLREVSTAQGPARWAAVLSSINAMGDDTRRDPTWVYWKARALLEVKPEANVATNLITPARQEAQYLLESIASPRGFYEQLALEQLGQKITLPARPAAVTVAERDVARANTTLQRALYAIRIGLRSEGVREWNYGTNLVNHQGVPGPMNERDLLASADLACHAQVWDRCINTSERTRTEFDFEQRFPMPFRDAVVKRSREIGLDPAYVYGLIRQESRFIMDARSGVGASGLMQVMPATAKWTAKKIGMEGFTPDQITQRDVNIAIGTGYLKLVLDDFAGSMPLAAAAYNAGPGRPRSWRNGPTMEAAIWAENVPFNETRDYVKKVLSNTTVYAAILTGQAQSLKTRLGQVTARDVGGREPNRDLP
jgi:soluble lytic murein transglycosylase